MRSVILVAMPTVISYNSFHFVSESIIMFVSFIKNIMTFVR